MLPNQQTEPVLLFQSANQCWQRHVLETHALQLNHELGIPSRVVNFSEHVPGGKHSKTNKYHPYENEDELMLALKLLFMTDNSKAAAWSL
jgi:hypothetical protein